MTESDSSVGDSLRKWRKNSGLSQLNLAIEAGVSSRHISFIETGKTHPTREMIIKLAEAMELTPEQLNSLLLAAGYTTENTVGIEPIEPFQQLVTRIIDVFALYPALVVNAEYDIVSVNRGVRLLSTLVPNALTKYNNLLELVAAPDGMRPLIANWSDVKHFAIERLRETTYSSNNQQLNELLSFVTAFQVPDESTAQQSPPHLYLIVNFQVYDQIIPFYALLLTPGTLLDNIPHKLKIIVFVPINTKSEADWHKMMNRLADNDAD